MAYRINTYCGITNEISDLQCQNLQRQQEIPNWNINFVHGFLQSSSLMFQLLLLTVKFKILFVIPYYFHHKLAKLEQNRMIRSTQNSFFFDKKTAY